MVVGVREGRHGVRLRALQHDGEIGEEHRRVEAGLLRVCAVQRDVRLEDADDLHVLARLRRPQEPGHVAVHEAGDRQFEGAGAGACADSSAPNEHASRTARSHVSFITSWVGGVRDQHRWLAQVGLLSRPAP